MLRIQIIPAQLFISFLQTIVILNFLIYFILILVHCVWLHIETSRIGCMAGWERKDALRFRVVL
jgi:hypothetical protein